MRYVGHSRAGCARGEARESDIAAPTRHIRMRAITAFLLAPPRVLVRSRERCASRSCEPECSLDVDATTLPPFTPRTCSGPQLSRTASKNSATRGNIPHTYRRGVSFALLA